MEQPQTYRSTPQPKKHRKSYAEWLNLNPNPMLSPENGKKLAEIGEHIMETIAQWYRSSLVAARRKTRLARQMVARKPTKPQSSRRRVNTRKP